MLRLTGLLKRANMALNAEALSHDVARGLVEEIKLEAALMDDSAFPVPPSTPFALTDAGVPQVLTSKSAQPSRT